MDKTKSKTIAQEIGNIILHDYIKQQFKINISQDKEVIFSINSTIVKIPSHFVNNYNSLQDYCKMWIGFCDAFLEGKGEWEKTFEYVNIRMEGNILIINTNLSVSIEHELSHLDREAFINFKKSLRELY